MTTMIERIARGLATADNRGDDWQQYTDKAAGVLLLMREPTKAMVFEGASSGGFDDYWLDNTIKVWRAMVDAASAEDSTNASQ